MKFLSLYVMKLNHSWLFFQGERPLAAFLYEKLKELLTSSIGRFIGLQFLQQVVAPRKFWKSIWRKKKLNSSDNLHLGVGTTRAINKCTTTKAIEVRKFRQNAQKMLVHFVEKFQTKIPLKLQIHTLYIVSFTKPGT